MVLDVGAPQLPQRPIPPVHHVWVAGPGDGRRLYRSTLFRTPGLIRLGIIWAICLALLIFSVVADPTHNITWLVIALSFPVVLIILLWRRSTAQAAMMAPGSVWASGFGTHELLLVTPISTLVIDYAALRPPHVIGPAVLIQTRRLASTTSLPLELFPPEAIAFLHERTTPLQRS
jgi:Na+/proline symporter